MHDTLRKFGYPDTLVHEGEHWALLVRPAQLTLGSVVLCATSDARSYAELPPEAFAEQRELVRLAERILRELTDYQRINYLMLMMVDPHVHFHVIPRYEGEREFGGDQFLDSGWPGLPRLDQSSPASPKLIERLRLLAATK
jgi:diadenosine tetraphosphate (Ap4A) HIT family hydrolase